jgi:phosphoglycolate phosphatase-like HAD superfamily hydrolase
VIIGDTPLDVDCAHAHGARAIAVATGHYSADELRAAGADLVVETLEDTPAIVGWLGHAPSGSED